MKLNNNNIITNIKSKFQSIRIKLFATLATTVAIIILLLILINSVVLEMYYIYSKQAKLVDAYELINSYYNGTLKSTDIELDIEKLSFRNDFDVLIKTDTSIYITSRDFLSSLTDVQYSRRNGIDEDLLYNSKGVKIKRTIDKQTELSFILLSATLDNGYQLYIRTAIAPIQANAKMANKMLMLIGFATVIISGMIVLVISRKFTSPIEELNKITKKISELDFSYKYRINDTEDEINNLRKKYKCNVRNTRKNNKSA